MRRRGLCLVLLIFEALWLNVIVPGHRRGIVQLPGACPLCAASPVHSSSSHTDSPASSPATCAICSFAAHLSTPPPIDLAPAPTHFLHRLAHDVPETLHLPLIPVSFDARGPPALA
jgi:hypothetical protein